MHMLESLLLVVHLLTAAAVCGFVLLQHGKGADMGAAFGSGASGSLFGAAGSANFLSRTTAILATVFFLSSLGLTWLAASQSGARQTIERGVMDKLPATKTVDAPSAPAGATPPGAPAEPAKVPAPAPATGAAPESKSGEVPK
jgi:preprotein translocase subunit SecG